MVFKAWLLIVAAFAGCIGPGFHEPPCVPVEFADVHLLIWGNLESLRAAALDSDAGYSALMSCFSPGGHYEFQRTGNSTAITNVTKATYANLRLTFSDSVARFSGSLPILRDSTVVVDLGGMEINVTLNGETVHGVRQELLRDAHALDPFERDVWLVPGEAADYSWSIPVNTSWNQGLFVEVGSPARDVVLPGTNVTVADSNGTTANVSVVRDEDGYQATAHHLAVGVWRVNLRVESAKTDEGVWARVIFTY